MPEAKIEAPVEELPPGTMLPAARPPTPQEEKPEPRPIAPPPGWQPPPEELKRPPKPEKQPPIDYLPKGGPPRGAPITEYVPVKYRTGEVKLVHYTVLQKEGYWDLKGPDKLTWEIKHGIVPHPAVKDIPIETFKGKIYVSRADVEKYNVLKGQAQFERGMKLGFFPKGSKFVGQDKEGFKYYTSEQWKEMLAAGPARIEFGKWKADKVELGDGQWILKSELAEIQKAYPELSKVLLAKGYDAYIKTWEANKTQLPDGQWIDNKQLAEIKSESPEIYTALTTKGSKAADALIEKQNKLYEANQVALLKLDDYTDKEGLIDITKYLRANPNDTKTLQDAGIESKDIDHALSLNREISKFYQRIENRDFTWGQADQLTDTIGLAGFRAKTIIGTYRTKTWGELTDDERMTVALLYEEPSLIRAAELVVPGVYVARHWTTLSTRDKVINIAWDSAAILGSLGIFKVIGVATRQLTGVARTTRLATQAGKVGRELNTAVKEFSQLQKIGKLKQGSPLWVRHANKIARLQMQSAKIDRQFIKALEIIDQISPRDLLNLEKRSGLTGLYDAVRDVSRGRAKVARLWDKVDKLKFNPNAKTPREIALNNRYLKALAELEKAQASLQGALSKAGSVLKPRYTPPIPADKFKGYGTSWKPKQAPPTVHAPDTETMKAIESYLARSKEVRPTGREPWVMPSKAAIAEKARIRVPKKVSTLKLKGIYEKPKVTPAPKPKTPAVSAFPGIKPIVKVTVRARERDIPTEEAGRMTQAQVAKYYGTEKAGVVDAVAKTIEEQLTQWKRIPRIDPMTKQTIRTIAQSGVEAFINASARDIPLSDVAPMVRNAIQAEVFAAAFPLTQSQVETLIKTVTDTIMRPPPPIVSIPPPLITPIPVTPLRILPSERKPIAEEKELEKLLAPIAWRQGFGWWVIFPPYKTRKDIKFMRKPPRGATVVKGIGSAYKTIQALNGDANIVLSIDMGIFDVMIERPSRAGKKGTIRFVRDPKQRTRRDISVTGVK